MPYIKPSNRRKFDSLIEKAVYELDILSSGDLNYFISSVVWKLFENDKSYSTANKLMGVLECVKQEFYRRKVVPYEEEKIKENGDL